MLCPPSCGKVRAITGTEAVAAISPRLRQMLNCSAEGAWRQHERDTQAHDDPRGRHRGL